MKYLILILVFIFLLIATGCSTITSYNKVRKVCPKCVVVNTTARPWTERDIKLIEGHKARQSCKLKARNKENECLWLIEKYICITDPGNFCWYIHCGPKVNASYIDRK